MESKKSRYGLFGTYRWVLACMVVLQHFSPDQLYSGVYAVFGFFILSGYLMTLVINEKYANLSRGLLKYYLNRFLRFYPCYFVVLVLTLLAIYVFPIQAAYYYPSFKMPDNLTSYISLLVIDVSKIFILRTESWDWGVIPQSWSLSVEVFFWGLLPFFTRNKTLFVVWAVLSLLFFSIFFINGFYLNDYSLIFRFFSPLGNSIAFLAGAYLYKFRDSKNIIPNQLSIAAIVLLIILSLFSDVIFKEPMVNGFYIAFILNVIVINYLSKTDQSMLPPFFCKVDKFLGDIAYSVFLSHYLIGLFVFMINKASVESTNYYLLILTLILTNIFSVGLYYILDRKVADVRSRVSK